MRRREVNIRKLERDKQMYSLILGVWKFIKPYTTDIPRTDKDWDKYVSEVEITRKALDHNLGTSETMFLSDLLVACNQYLIRREAESRRAPD